MSLPHATVPVLVWADVDVGIADFVRYLNTIPGIRTISCCEATGNSYKPYVMATWTDEAREHLKDEFDFEPQGDHWGYIHPPAPPTEAKP